MSKPLVKVKGLVRWFEKVRAVNGVSFDLPAGQVVGLIGANGAGKTTAMRILATLDQADAGTVLIDGVDIVEHPEAVRRRLGWMPDNFTPYPDMTVGDYIDFFGRAHGFRSRQLAQRVAEVMDFTDLVPLSDRLIDQLSKGQTQRLCLGRTLLNDPDFLILDEPAAGLDPKARLEFKNLVRILRDRGKTLLISSHILSELGEMCDTLVFMDNGRVMHHGDIESLQRRGAADSTPGAAIYDIAVAGPVEPLLAWLSVRPGWKCLETRKEGARAEFAGAEPATVAAELRRLVADLPVVEFRRHERRLEETFVDMLRQGQVQSQAAAGTRGPPSLPNPSETSP